MISVVIPVAHEEPGLLDTLAALVPAVADGLVRDLVLVTAAPNRFAEDVADASGCGVLVSPGARAAQLAAAAAVLRAPWILALEPGLVPAGGWMDEIADFVADSGQTQRACAFKLVPRAGASRLRPRWVNWRLAMTGRADPLQGLAAPAAAMADGSALRLRVARLTSSVLDRRSTGR